ncbi:MAG: hypothetical protein JWP27_2052 [Flaviaesturariibacter sp.]|nr:hypothetical protein [Flaviaesturariibacter sp.]
MKTEQDLELLGFTYYEPAMNEHRNIRKDYNTATLLFFTLVGLFGISLAMILVFNDQVLH